MGRDVTSFGDARRVASAHKDLPSLIAAETRLGLILLDDDHREQPVTEGQVIRLGVDSLIFRHDGLDEEISLAIISKRVLGDDVLVYSPPSEGLAEPESSPDSGWGPEPSFEVVGQRRQCEGRTGGSRARTIPLSSLRTAMEIGPDRRGLSG
jgi:hypothetical protein